jgi:hypothetical protein
VPVCLETSQADGFGRIYLRFSDTFNTASDYLANVGSAKEERIRIPTR